MHSSALFLPVLLAFAYAKGPAAAATTGGDASGVESAMATATNGPGVNLNGPCFPKMSNGSYDPTAPCRMVLVQSVQCLFGKGKNDTSMGSGDATEDAAEVAKRHLAGRGQQNLFNGTMNQQCVCEAGQPGSTYFENVAGCSECMRLHGEKQDWVPAQLIPEASSSFCAMTSPTQNVANFLQGFVKTASTPALGTSTPTDVLGTSTAISLYFTSTPVAASTTGATSASSTAGGAPAITKAPLGGAVVAGVLGLAAFL